MGLNIVSILEDTDLGHVVWNGNAHCVLKG